MEKMKKAISVLLTLAMTITNYPISAWTQETSTEVFVETSTEPSSEVAMTQEVPLESSAEVAVTQEVPLEETTSAQVLSTESPAEGLTEMAMETVGESVPYSTEETAVSESMVSEATLFEAANTETAAAFSYTVLNGTYCQITKYTGNETEVSIPAELDGYIVQSIANEAFRKNYTLEKVVFPDTIETMGAYVFYDCESLREVHLNEGLNQVGNYTFYSCTNLTSIVLPETVTEIGEAAFGNCSSLVDITFPKKLTTIQSYAFRNCISLVTIELPDSVEGIGYFAFAGCEKLSNINYPQSWNHTISSSNYDAIYNNGCIFKDCISLKRIEVPEGVTTIPAYAFNGCDSLEEVALSSTVVEIGKYAFYQCSNLKEIAFPAALTTIGEAAFFECTSITTIAIPSTITSMGSSVFARCTALESVSVLTGVTDLAARIFEGCTSLTTVILPEGLQTIQKQAFSGCSQLMAIQLPDSVKKIGYQAFANCTQLININYPLSLEGSADNGSSSFFTGCTSLKKIEVPEGVTTLPNSVFSGCESLEEITLPDTLATIGNQAFFNCSGLKSIEIPDTVISIGESVFWECTGLKTVVLSDQITTLPSYTFYRCSELTTIKLPAGLRTIQQGAFDGCAALTKLVLPDSVEEIGYEAFVYCTNLTSINYPINWKTVLGSNGGIFKGCINLKKIEIPEGVTQIPDYAFAYCDNLEEVVFPNGLTTIGRSSFFSCSGIKTIQIPDTVTSMGTYAFYDCTGLKEVSISNGITQIPTAAFLNCSGITNIKLPENLLSIEEDAFGNCGALTKVVLPDSVEKIGYHAFINCTKLNSINYPLNWRKTDSYYNSEVFSGCVNLKRLEIPVGVSEVFQSALSGCSSLEKVILPNTITTIAGYAFYNCTGLKEILLPENATTIEQNAFSNCSNMKQIWIGEAVSKIEDNAFSNCESLTIHGVEGSYAQEYAIANGIPFSTENIVYQMGSIEGRVTSPDGVGIADVAVTLYDCTKGEVQAYLCTDENGFWSCSEAYVGHTYRVQFYHADYEIANDSIEYSIEENAVIAETVIATEKTHVEETDPADFTYKILNGTYCEITGYNGNEAVVRIPTEIGGYTVQRIANYAFRDNQTVATLVLANTIELIGDSAFSRCKNLKEIRLNGTLTKISNSAFYNCTALEKITFPSSITEIGKYAFYGCKNLKTISFKEGLKCIQESAFASCIGVTQLEFPDSVEEIGYRAFQYCTSLCSIKYPVGWKKAIGSNNSYGSTSNNGRIFEDCTSLKKIEIPEGVTAIPDYAFNGCEYLEEVILPTTITQIGSYAYYGCHGLKEIRLPDALTAIGNGAFEDCTGLKTVTISEGITDIPAYAFSACSGLTTINLPEGLLTIQEEAFSECTSLVRIQLPDSVEGIGKNAFADCTKLSSINYPLNWKKTICSASYDSIYNNGFIFYGCKNLKKIEIPEGVKRIPAYAFHACDYLEKVILPQTVATIEDNTFYECSRLKEIILPENATTIGAEAFANCTKLKKVWIDKNVSSIGDCAFLNCNALTIHGVEASYAQEYANVNRIPFSTENMNYPTAFLKGQVVDENAVGIEGVTVTIYDVTANEIQERIITDADGYWNYNEAYIGHTYQIQFYQIDYDIAVGNYEYLIDENGVTIPSVVAVRKTNVEETDSADFTYNILNGVYCEITGYKGTAEAIRIPSEMDGYIVQRIGEYAFSKNTSLTTVVFPDTIEVIRAYAFSGCSSLTDIRLNEGLTDIYNDAFFECTALKEIVLPATVLSLSDEVFSGCVNLTDIYLPNGLENIGSFTFSKCKELKAIRIPDTVTELGKYTFYNCTNLQTILLSKNLVTIEAYAFSECRGFEKLELPDSVEKIGYRAFENCTNLSSINYPLNWKEAISNTYYKNTGNTGEIFNGCTSLKQIEVPEGVTAIPDYAFNGCDNLEKVTLPQTLTTMGNYAFYECKNLTEAELPENVSTMGNSVYSYCSGLKAVVIQNGVTNIGEYAFYNCTNLADVTLPNTVTTIQQRAFEECNALINIKLPDCVEEIGYRAFANCTRLSSINYPLNWKEAISNTYYKNTGNTGEIFNGCTSLKQIEVPEGVTAIPDYAFNGCDNLEKVTLPQTLTTMGNYAFYECKNLTEAELPENVSTMGNSVYSYCSGLKAVVIQNGVTNIGEYAFYNCTNLADVTLPNTVTTIQQRAFEECNALINIKLPDCVEEIGYRAFANCTRLSSINYPLNWKEAISNTYYKNTGNTGEIFNGCTSLKQIEVPEGVTAIPDYAFNGCDNLEEVILPETVTAIGGYTFYNNKMLRSMKLPETVTRIPEYCFYNCVSLDSVVIPAETVSVGNYAYYKCSGIRTITSAGKLETIGISAFYGCDGVISLVLNDGLKTISNTAFSNCSNLKAVEIAKSVTTIGSGAFEYCPKLTIYCYSGSEAHLVSEAQGYRFYLLDEHEHEYITTIETAPTCTRGGSQILTCSICGYYRIDILNALGHEYSNEVIAPTCTEDGYTFHECSRCKDQYQDAFVPATGHDYGEWETITEVSCVIDGYQKRVCKVCKNEESKRIIAPGHDYKKVVIAPTCTAKGCTVYTCTVCNNTYADTYVNALDHSFGEWVVTKEATILEAGVRIRTCMTCGKEETEEIAKLTVDLENNLQYGLAKFTVLDALSVKPVSGASIFIKTEKDGETTLITDEKGKVSQILPVGQWTAAVYADGYLVRNLKITVKAGEQDIPPIGISNKPLVDATITSREMTYEEIIAAGIHVNDSENRHYYEYVVEIRFSETLDAMTLISYGDDEGNILSTVSNNTNRTVYALSHNESEVAAEPVTVVYSDKYGVYIADRSTFTNAVWSPKLGSTIAFSNNGYFLEGYGIPSTLTVAANRVFPSAGWTYDKQSGELSMSVGTRTHYLTFRDGTFCTVSNHSDAISISLFEKIPASGYPTEAEYVYIPADTFEEGKEYLLVQFQSKSSNNREALSHSADQSAHETVTIYADDVYGEYIADCANYENAVWSTSTAKADGFKIANKYYFAQANNGVLKYEPLANETGWKLEQDYLTTQIDGETFYLRYANGEYHVTKSEAYAGSVMIFEKMTVADVVSDVGQTSERTIYRRVNSFEAGKEYIIVGSGKNPSSISGGSNGGGYSGGYGGGFSGTLSDGTTVTIYPVSEQFYLIIYGEVCWLKEMFDVEMLVVNNSATDTIENCVAELILPDGLSLATLVTGEQSAVQKIDQIPSNESHSLHWYVRGDKEGSYNITATLAGTMMPFQEDFFYEYEVDSPIRVYAGDAMKMTFYLPEAAYNNTDYTVRIEIENVSNKILYGVTHSIKGWEEGKITYYSDGRKENEVYGSGGSLGSIGADAFYPGDKIVIEVSFEVLFKSSIIEGLMGAVDKSEQLYKSYQAVKSGLDMLKSLTDFCSSATKSLDKIVKADEITDAKKREATKELLSAFNKLYGKIEKGDSKALKMVSNVQSSELYKAIKSCSDAAGCEAFVKAESVETILEIANKIKCTIEDDEEDEADKEKKFNTFDSLRTMVSNLPIRYVVNNVMVSTMGNSTTSIPYSTIFTPVDSPYMGVDSWGKYLYNMTIASMGKISSPWYAQLFGAPDDITGYDAAVAYVKQVESQMAAYSVHKSSGTKFEAWVEKASSTNSNLTPYTSGVSSNFLLETDNESAMYENGRLTFTGNATLEVTALSMENGILYIKDDEGNIRTIVINVVEPHTCSSDKWIVGVAPTEEFDGYRVKQCDICQDILAVETLSYCGNHQFGEWITKREATEKTMGIEYRECQNCYAKEIRYVPAAKGPDLVSVDIEWGDMSFTYTQGTWNTDSHTYAEGTWSDGDSGYITITNTGNIETNIQVEFVSEQKEISGCFTDEKNVVTDCTNIDVNQSKDMHLQLSGKPDRDLDDTKIGTVTVRIGGE